MTQAVELEAGVGDEVEIEGVGLFTVVAVAGGEVVLTLAFPQAAPQPD